MYKDEVTKVFENEMRNAYTKYILIFLVLWVDRACMHISMTYHAGICFFISDTVKYSSKDSFVWCLAVACISQQLYLYLSIQTVFCTMSKNHRLNLAFLNK